MCVCACVCVCVWVWVCVGVCDGSLEHGVLEVKGEVLIVVNEDLLEAL